MYITRVRLKNIRCFEKIDLKFDLKGPKLPWTLILGDNATGKTALLRAIAIGLCDEPSAAGLIKESDEGYIKRGKDIGWIEIWVKPSPRSKREYCIKTNLKKIKTRGGGYEEVKKDKRTALTIPYTRIFVCAYGAGRGTSGTGDVVGYSSTNAVFSWFNYYEGLQNPELMLLRIPNLDLRAKVRHFLSDFVLGPEKNNHIRVEESGIKFVRPYEGEISLRDVADGYKSCFMWVADFIGWALNHQPNPKSLGEVRGGEVRGIVLVEELEQHLHPSWQAVIIENLRNAFPNIQFITSTHSPILVSSVNMNYMTCKYDRLLYLERDGRNVLGHEEPPMDTWDIDKILGARVLNYVTMTSSQWNKKCARLRNWRAKEHTGRHRKKRDTNPSRRKFANIMMPLDRHPLNNR